jgi:hypothetical protein
MSPTPTLTVQKAILDLIDVSGPQDYTSILSEVRTQVIGMDSVSVARSATDNALNQLIRSGKVVLDGKWGNTVYGRPSDF